ncbi:pyruvate dehydrogenase (acetyl-transferring) E1 component subunit alpha [Haladaptatus salinisoli]|uniref:pyruvate dehydrogenase (acetyl-transferring) E1 component subunit alpha n=1 Tax=Haladaptatus salinisoli TaxID=2884876 RepID=UPI001D0B6CBA|nr:pyruvate dehydrogenase (acetyl-transferring) E1 component subunit alpha [Haladaptatus salinisoli]
MPRNRVAEFEVDFVQALDAEGTVDTDFVPDVGDDRLREMYRQMKRARRLDERAIALQRRGEIGTYAPGIGQEGTQVASAVALAERDWLVPSFREQAAFLARGIPPEAILRYAMGMEEGAEIPEGHRELPPSIPVGSQALHAAGIGWGETIRGEDAVALTFFGDGATSEGDVYEATNVAGALDAQVVFVCQNNQYAISTPRTKQTRAETLAQKAIAAGIEGVQVDGNDALGVYSVVADAVESARRGDPVFVEAMTYRRSMHTTADDPSIYRTEDEEREWETFDPILRFERYLESEGVLSEDDVEEIDAEIEEELADAIEAVREATVEYADMFEFVFAETPPTIQRQREAFERGE